MDNKILMNGRILLVMFLAGLILVQQVNAFVIDETSAYPKEALNSTNSTNITYYGGSNTAVGLVKVMLVEPVPEPSDGLTGFISFSPFDFEEFFSELSQAINSIFNL